MGNITKDKTYRTSILLPVREQNTRMFKAWSLLACWQGSLCRTCWSPFKHQYSSFIIDGRSMTFKKANDLLGLLNGLFLCSHPCSGSGCFADARSSVPNEIHIFTLNGCLKGNVITKRPQTLHFYISKPWTLPFSLILSCSPFVRGMVFEMKDTCLAVFKESQNFQRHLYCRAILFQFYIPILGWWSKGSDWREKLKDVFFGVNNNTNPQTLGLSLN